jgi:dTDP-4-dehydrorhamnose reductase
MKILLTGKNGQVGFELQRALAPLGEVVAVDHRECDLANPDAIRKLMAEVGPQVIINPAAYTAVDKAESEPELAQAINGVAPGIFGEEAKRLGALVVHYSTDYVFDGARDGEYTEQDKTSPQSVYGQTKLAGEQALLTSGADCLIFRTSWVFGAHGANFAKTMLRLAGERDTLKIVADQFGAPTKSARNVLRGLHYQVRQPQGKLVRVVQGEVFDVAVDIRKNSPTYGQWVGLHLSAENKKQLWIPPGLAHGFVVLSETAEFLYKTTDYYAPALERCIRWNDPDIGIEWPIEGEPLLSAKDKAGVSLAQAEC